MYKSLISCCLPALRDSYIEILHKKFQNNLHSSKKRPNFAHVKRK